VIQGLPYRTDVLNQVGSARKEKPPDHSGGFLSEKLYEKFYFLYCHPVKYGDKI